MQSDASNCFADKCWGKKQINECSILSQKHSLEYKSVRHVVLERIFEDLQISREVDYN